MSNRRGKKRGKSATDVPPVVRIRRDRIILHGLAFDFTTPSPESKLGVVLLGNPASDTLPFELRFDPPLEKIYAASSTVSVMHIESKRTDTRITLLPHTDQKRLTKERYFEFVTHVAKMDVDTVSVVELVYLTLNNEQLRGDNPTPIWRPSFNLSVGFFEADRYTGLPFFPPDTPLTEPVNLAQVPQNTGIPIQHKPAGGITSSRVPKLLGYYPGPDVFTGWKSAAVRFGRMSEPKVILTYLEHHKDYTFKETGFTSVENAGILDGAQCDGLVTDTTTGVQFPIEFKASRSNCNFDGAHMAQCIWEMACGYPYIDLVRYCERQTKNAQGTWETGYECKEIRLFRHPATETQIIKLCQEAHALRYKEHALFDTEPFVQMRRQLDELAAQANRDAKHIPVDPAVLQSLEDYKERVLQVQNADNQVTHPLMDRIERRQAHIFAAFTESNVDEVRKEVAEQIQDYMELWKL